MSIPLNPIAFQHPSQIQTLADAQLWINRFARPERFNIHAWHTTKKLALLVWKCHLERRPIDRTLNFLHPTFYHMIRTPEGMSLLVEHRVRKFAS